jgi:hypothetical protein
MRYNIIGVVIGALWGWSIYYLTGDAFEKGYTQGYYEGQGRAEMMSEQEVFMQCTKWWFDGSESRAKQAINQYCERSKK